MKLNEILSQTQIADIESFLDESRFAAGSCIFQQGDAGTEAFIIESGVVRIELHVAEAGENVVLGKLTEGQMLGEFCLLDKGTRSASAFADTEVVSRKLTADSFEKLCTQKPHVGLALMNYFSKELIRKTRSSNESLENFLNQVLEYYPGLLFILDKNGNVGQYSSGTARKMYGRVQGQFISKILYSENSTAHDHYSSVLQLATAQPENCSQFMKDLTDSLLLVDGKSYDLSYHATSIREGTVESILLLGADVTAQLREKERAEQAQREADMISSIAGDIPGLLSFEAESEQLLLSIGEYLSHNGQDTIAGLFRSVHTIKGSAAGCGLYKIEKTAHDLETELAKLRTQAEKDPALRLDTSQIAALTGEISKLQELLHSEFSRIRAIFQMKDDVVRISESDLAEALRKNLSSPETFNYLQRPRFDHYLKNLAGKTLDRAIAALKRQGKEKLFDLEISVSQDRLSATGQGLLDTCFSHLLRNMADHGIEESAERTMLGKPAAGKISIRQALPPVTSRIDLEISDDGAGINTDAVGQKAMSAGLIDKNHHITMDEACELLFRPGFSTSNEVSALSGRGVGMDAVRDTLSRVGGTIRIRSEEGKGFTATISLPQTAIF